MTLRFYLAMSYIFVFARFFLRLGFFVFVLFRFGGGGFLASSYSCFFYFLFFSFFLFFILVVLFVRFVLSWFWFSPESVGRSIVL